MLFVENSPWPTLTLVVSLEAIFLSTFVMIGQNRAAAFQQAKANHDFVEQETELKTNTAAHPRDPPADDGAAPPGDRRDVRPGLTGQPAIATRGCVRDCRNPDRLLVSTL